MAEIRKHNPKTSKIGDLVRAAAGEDIRPVTPGQPKSQAEPRPSNFDPFVDEDASSEQTSASKPSSAGTISAGSWITFNAFDQLKKPADED